MIYDPKRRSYIDRGRVIPPQEIRDEIESYIDQEKSDVDSQAKKVLAGSLALTAFFEFLRLKIAQWHTHAGVIAYGGQSQMNLDRWKRVNEKIQKELAFLDNWKTEAEKGFQSTRFLAAKAASLVEDHPQVPAGLESVVQREVQSALITSAAERPQAVTEAVTSALSDSVDKDVAELVAETITKDLLDSERIGDLIWGSLGSRSQQYANNTYSTYENSVKARESDAGAVGARRVCLNDAASCDDCPSLATEEYVSMDEITDIGDGCACLSSCRCEFEFLYLNVEPLEINREIYA